MMVNNCEEKWIPVDGYDGKYEVSSLGRVRSFARKSYNGKLLVQREQNGYLAVHLSKSGKCKAYLVHRLVATAFIPNKNNLPQVNHKDENKKNNSVENLEWCSCAYNLSYGTAPARRAMSRGKPCVGTWPDGTEKSFFSTGDAERNTGISHAHISQVCNGIWHSAGGVVWRYTDERI